MCSFINVRIQFKKIQQKNIQIKKIRSLPDAITEEMR